MRKILIFLLITCTCNSYGQQLFMELGRTMSSFDYKNSQGVALDNLLSKPNNYIKMGYRDNLNHDKTLFVSIGGSYNGYGAIGSDRTLNNYFEWDVTYLGFDAGLDLKLFGLRDFSFFLKGSASAEFLIQGTQTVNNQVFNLVGEDEFNSNIFFMRGGFAMTYPISRNTLITVGYNIGKTVLLSKGGATDQEELKLLAHQFGFGIIINLPNCNCSF